MPLKLGDQPVAKAVQPQVDIAANEDRTRVSMRARPPGLNGWYDTSGLDYRSKIRNWRSDLQAPRNFWGVSTFRREMDPEDSMKHQAVPVSGRYEWTGPVMRTTPVPQTFQPH